MPVSFALAANVLAQASKSKSGSPIASLLPLVLLLGVFWFVIMRPQQRRTREHRSLMTDLKQGDKVTAAGGIQGTIRRIDDDTISLQVADNVVLKVDKGTVVRKLQQT